MGRKNVAMHLSEVSGFMVLPFLFAAELVFAVADLEEAKNSSSEKSSAGFRSVFNDGGVRVVGR
jgi:hypothetical protein